MSHLDESGQRMPTYEIRFEHVVVRWSSLERRSPVARNAFHALLFADQLFMHASTNVADASGSEKKF
jgi:hypothetical protein